MGDPVRAHFVCGGKWHDMDFARVEVLKLLGEQEEIRTQVAGDFRDVEALAMADFLVTYASRARPRDSRMETGPTTSRAS